jgi:hypothetical protein
MPLYLISYDLHRERDYPRLYEALDYLSAVKLLESVWLADLTGPAAEICRLLSAHIDADDSLAIIELAPGIQWSAIRPEPAGGAWLLQRFPFHN